MKALKWIGWTFAGYVVLVCAFEAFVGYAGKQDAADGIAPDEEWVLLRTTDAEGAHDTVVAGVEVDGKLYVAANHWPRAWFARAIERPLIEVTQHGKTAIHQVVQPVGTELERVEAAYALPLVLRLLTGFPPREFLRLDPR